MTDVVLGVTSGVYWGDGWSVLEWYVRCTGVARGCTEVASGHWSDEWSVLE